MFNVKNCEEWKWTWKTDKLNYIFNMILKIVKFLKNYRKGFFEILERFLWISFVYRNK